MSQEQTKREVKPTPEQAFQFLRALQARRVQTHIQEVVSLDLYISAVNALMVGRQSTKSSDLLVEKLAEARRKIVGPEYGDEAKLTNALIEFLNETPDSIKKGAAKEASEAMAAAAQTRIAVPDKTLIGMDGQPLNNKEPQSQSFSEVVDDVEDGGDDDDDDKNEKPNSADET